MIKKSIIQTGAHALLIADAFYLYSYSYEKSFTEIGIAHGAGLLAIGLSIFFLSFLKRKMIYRAGISQYQVLHHALQPI